MFVCFVCVSEVSAHQAVHTMPQANERPADTSIQ